MQQQYPYQGFGMQGHVIPPVAQTQRQSDKWFYMSVLLVVAFCLFQGWKAYQESVQFEKKIHRLQKRREHLRKQKVERAKLEAEREAAIAEEINKQIKIQDNFDKLVSMSQYNPDSDDELKEKHLEPRDELRRTKSMAVKQKDFDTASRRSGAFDDPIGRQQSKIPITRICLTGGPCAGKTTALATLSLHLKQLGYRVLLVPEAATILMQGGAMIQTPKMTFSNAVKF